MTRNFVALLAITTLLAASTHAQTDRGEHRQGVPAPRPSSARTTTSDSGPHGGSLKQAGELQFETVVSRRGINVFVYDRDGKAVAVTRARGAVSLRVDEHSKRYHYDLLPDGKGGLTAPVDLSKVSGRQLELEIKLMGLPAAAGGVVVREAATVPPSEAQLTAAAIARQKICPVMDEPLGSMGTPVKVVVDDRPIYLCCKGCIKKVKAEPAKYLALAYDRANPSSQSVPANGDQVREGVFKVSKVDQPFIAAQQKCPVMDEPLQAMGGPYKVNADGKAIYICCPGCAKRIQADPKKFLGILESQGVSAPAMR